MAAGEDQSQPVVAHGPDLDRLVVRLRAAAACAWRSSRDDSRRSRSMARLRAVVMIQPPGFGGTPVSGQRLDRDDERLLDRLLGDVDVAEEADQGRDRPAGLLPEDPLDAVPVAIVGHGRYASGSSWNGRTSTGALARDGGLRRPRQRGVEVGGLDDPEAAELLLRLGERAVGGRSTSPFCDPDDRGGVGGVQPAGEHPGARGLHLLVDGVDVGVHLLRSPRRRASASPSTMCTDSMYCVIGSLLVSESGTVPLPQPVYERGPRRIDSSAKFFSVDANLAQEAGLLTRAASASVAAASCSDAPASTSPPLCS